MYKKKERVVSMKSIVFAGGCFWCMAKPYYEYDGVSANDYLWASYDFMFEAYDEEGNFYYDERFITCWYCSGLCCWFWNF